MKLVWNSFLFPQSSWFLTDRWLLNIISLQIWKLSSSIHSMARTVGAFYFSYFNMKYNKFTFFSPPRFPYHTTVWKSDLSFLGHPSNHVSWTHVVSTLGTVLLKLSLLSPQSQAFGQAITGFQRCVKRSEGPCFSHSSACLLRWPRFTWSSSWIFYNLWTFFLRLSVSPTRPISFCVLVFWLWRANFTLFLFFSIWSPICLSDPGERMFCFCHCLFLSV